MSWHVRNLVWSRIVGSLTRKAILLALAERAGDDGGGVWISKTRVSSEVECSRQTVFATIRELVSDGLVKQVGRRKSRHGYTIIYQIDLKAVRSLPEAWPADEDPEPDATEQGDGTVQKQVSSSFTLRPEQVSNSGPVSVKLVDTNSPYRTRKDASLSEKSFSKASKPSRETVAGLTQIRSTLEWEQNRCRTSDRERFHELQAEIDTITDEIRALRQRSA